jgi:hypothetical protein
MAVFILPKTREILKYHTRWNDQALNPYIDDLIDLWAENDIYGSLLLQSLTDRLAEAGASYLHYLIRTKYWGYSAESSDPEEIFQKKAPGIRPAPHISGLPAGSSLWRRTAPGSGGSGPCSE